VCEPSFCCAPVLQPNVFASPANLPACQTGQLEVLHFLQGRNCPINLAVCAVAAAAAGHVHVLQWLAQEHPGCLASPDMDCLPTIVAAATGQLAVLQVRLLKSWLHAALCVAIVHCAAAVWHSLANSLTKHTVCMCVACLQHSLLLQAIAKASTGLLASAQCCLPCVLC
jgi:hypothetical protein